MSKLLLKEILQFCILMMLISFFSYLVLYYLPGSSDTLKQGTEMGGGHIKEQQKSFLHITEKYVVWLGRAFKGDFGRSDFSGESVFHIVFPRLLRTLALSFVAVISVLIIAVCWVNLEVWIRKDERNTQIWARFVWILLLIIERVLLSFIPLTMAVLVYSFFSGVGVNFLNLSSWQRGVFPWLTLILLNLPLYIRSLKKSMNMVSSSRFVAFLQTLGYTERWIWWREILPNAFVFTLTLSIVQLSYLVGGTIIVEKIFLYPGLGSLLFDAVMNRDRDIVQVTVVLIASMVSIIHMYFVLYKTRIYGRNDV